jgi:Mn2+/Fe2+ NRAMP family transporter
VAVALVVHVPWGTVLGRMVAPRISFDAAYLTVVVAVLGTTISPYLFFWQAEEEVEEIEERAGALPLHRAPDTAAAEFRRIRIDTWLGMGMSNLVALFIMTTAAATLHARGITDIQTSSQAALALKPIAGRFAFELFALGIIGTGLLAVPVLAGSTAYAVGETFGWTVGLGRRLGRARAFYGVLAASILCGCAMNVIHIDPVKALFWSAVINGVAAVPVMALMMHLSCRRDIMGRFVLPMSLRIVGWVATVAMAVAAVGMFATMGA